MHERLLDRLACPACRSALRCDTESRAADGEVVSGRLVCEGCRAVYPIERRIPRFVPSENYAASFGYQWNKFRQEQIDADNGMRQSEARLWSETGWTPEWTRGRWILDGGCGAGRFLEVVSRSGEAESVGVDISSAIDAAAETVAGRSNVHLVQASLFALPFRPGAFDGAYCIGVIQHTPDPAAAVRGVADMVAPGGRIAVTAYERRRFTPLYSKYWLRPLTRRLTDRHLLTAIKVAMPVLFALSEVLFRIPVLGRVFQFVIPVANYVHDPAMTMRQRYQWAILDTFDMLAPAYDAPQRESDVRTQLAASGITDVVRLGNAGLNLVGRRDETGQSRERGRT